MRLAFLHNARPAVPASNIPDDAFEEYDSDSTIASIAAALQKICTKVVPVLADARLPERLLAGHFDFAFNMAEGKGRRCREAIARGHTFCLSRRGQPKMPDTLALRFLERLGITGVGVAHHA